MDLQKIPGIGKSIEKDLNNLSIYKVEDLKTKNPEKLYSDLCNLAGIRLDPCLLYTFRCAVYFAKTKEPNPKLLKWWNWKDKS